MEVREVRMGNAGPILKEMSICRGTDGSVEAMDVSIFFESQDMLISLFGRTMVGSAFIQARIPFVSS